VRRLPSRRRHHLFAPRPAPTRPYWSARADCDSLMTCEPVPSSRRTLCAPRPRPRGPIWSARTDCNSPTTCPAHAAPRVAPAATVRLFGAGRCCSPHHYRGGETTVRPDPTDVTERVARSDDVAWRAAPNALADDSSTAARRLPGSTRLSAPVAYPTPLARTTLRRRDVPGLGTTTLRWRERLSVPSRWALRRRPGVSDHLRRAGAVASRAGDAVPLYLRQR
jgi:hypothetical protein